MPTPPELPGSDFTLGLGDLYAGDRYFAPSANIAVTLHEAAPDIDVTWWHVSGAFTLTVKLPSAATYAVLTVGQNVRIRTYLDSSSVWQYEAINTYTVTNGAADRSYDANATTTDELADVLYSLISDLKAKGVVA